jgi:protein involved in polysaccharide export with SLBB domain
MQELRDRDARVSADYTIELPVLGTVNVKGMGESGVRRTVRDHLKEYMKDPQVDVFVKQYRSREVAVGGMVEKPGLYTLNDPSDTILDMIGRAGGVKESASTRIIFIPAAAAASSRVPLTPATPDDNNLKASGKPRVAATTGAAKPLSAQQPDEKDSATDSSSGGGTAAYYTAPANGRDPIVIDISSLKNNSKLDVPAWPGDVIIVPAAGEVMVRGWVKNPGAFNITPGMTVLGAVTAAGGELYSSSVELLRTADDGQQTKEALNLGELQRGTQADLPVQSGDVVVINRSVAGAVPYFLDTLFSKFSTGAYLPLL